MITRKEKYMLNFFNVKKYVKLMLAFLKTAKEKYDIQVIYLIKFNKFD